MTHETEYDDSGTFPTLRRRTPSKEKVADWLTWGTRAVIIGICTLAYHSVQQIEATLQETQSTLQTTQITIAKVSVQQDNQTQQLQQHAAQIERIWQEIKRQ